MGKQKEKVIENMARVGYDTLHEEKWDDLPHSSAVRVMWEGIATNMLNELRRTWESAKNEYKFNPDYLDFKKGVYAGRVLENERIRKNIQLIGTYWLRHDSTEGFSMTKEEFEQALKSEIENDIELRG